MIKTVGDHRVRHGDIREDFDELFLGRKAYILYCDPPWNDGNIKWWNTYKLKQNEPGKSFYNSYEGLLDRIIELIRLHVRGYVFIEGGVRQRAIMREKLSSVLYDLHDYDILYKSGDKIKPNIIFSGTTTKGLNYYNKAINYKQGDELLVEAFRGIAKSGEIVFDPTCGLGTTARVAKRHNMIFIGNEYIGKRFNTTIKVLNGG